MDEFLLLAFCASCVIATAGVLLGLSWFRSAAPEALADHVGRRDAWGDGVRVGVDLERQRAARERAQ